MCGITGFVDFSSKTDPKAIVSMTDSISYRGPDSSGKFVSKNGSAVLGIRRLSIIDLKTGDQPISNEDATVTVVFNGEIYNYKSLKNNLIKKHHKFKTNSDTEVLVHLYEEYGEKMAGMLNGMFAFAVWDEKKGRLFLSRDRAGIKPLYYYHKGNLLVFGSEAKTILKSGLYKKKIDDNSLALYLYLGYLPYDFSMFEGVRKLLPGHFISYSKNGLKIGKYFELPSEKKVEDQSLDTLLENSVKLQLNADVPVGVFLSGGLDSSLLAYYISQEKKLNSFSIGFKEEGYDESSYAHTVAKKLGTKHFSEEFGVDDVVKIYDEIKNKLDEPLADASLIPTYKVCQLARKHVKVVLSGDGADELFGGYPTYQAQYFKKVLPGISPSIASSILELMPEVIVDLFPTSFKDYPKKKLAKIVLKGLSMDNPERHLYWMRSFFLGEENVYRKPDLKFFGGYIPDVDGLDDTPKIGQLIDFYSYLRDDFLVKVDRASMYNSLEVRVPYLDNDIVDYAFSVNRSHANFLKTKILMRELLEEKLPEVAKRPKKGFGIPLVKWLRSDLKDFAYSYITNDKLERMIPKKKINKIWKDHQTGEKNNAGTIWMLTILSGWLENWG